MTSRNLRTLFSFFGLLFMTWSFVLCKQQDANADELTVEKSSYVGDLACRSCHAEEFNDWKGSHHFHAMEKPDSNSVRGNFNDQLFSADGVSYRFFQTGNKYQVTITEREKTTTTYSIAYTFGWEPLQQYLIAMPGGRLQTLRASWDTEQKIWFHQYPDTLISTGDWLHWTGAAQTWNSMCAACHSTNLEKKYTQSTDSFQTSYDIINVSCESCHGPGQSHISLMEAGNKKNHSGIDNYPKENHAAQVDMCAACHGLRTQLTASNNPTGNFLQRFSPDLLREEMFYRDGQQKGEVYNYASFLTSKMYMHKVACTDCHNPHSNQLKFDGNTLCLQCHNSSYDATTHHFHPMQTASASCVSCHMPGKNYMVNDYRHDHSFRVPRPDQSAVYGTPNTCNSCHEDQTAQWAADQIIKWYGKERAWHFSDALLPAGKRDGASSKYLRQLITQPAVPNIVRATAVQELAGMLDNTSIEVYRSAFIDSSAIVRQTAYNSLLSSGLDRSDSYFQQGWQDTVLAVRLAAYRATADIPTEGLSPELLGHKQAAGDAYFQFLLNNADMVNGQVLFSEYYQQKGNIPAAIDAYLQALKLDKLQGEVRLNLAILHSRNGEADKALEQVQAYNTLFPVNSRGHYFEALLQSERKNYAAAIISMEQALESDPQNPDYYYNYILMLDKAGRRSNAAQVLQHALHIFPGNEALTSLTPYFK